MLLALSAFSFRQQRGGASPLRLWRLTSLPEHTLAGFPVHFLWSTDKTQRLLFSQESSLLGRDLPLAQSAAVTGEGGAAGSCSGLQPVGELEQGLLAVDDIQVVDIGLQLLMLLWRHVTSKLVSPAVSQSSNSVCNHVQFFEIDEIIQKCFISFMNKCYIFKQ